MTQCQIFIAETALVHHLLSEVSNSSLVVLLFHSNVEVNAPVKHKPLDSQKSRLNVKYSNKDLDPLKITVQS